MRFIPENQSVHRKNASQIIESIYNALGDGRYHTISEISRLAKSNWTTIKNQIDIIVKIQELPNLKIINASKQVLVKKQ
ncbi:MAG: hypothetical protein EU529_04295 [Promethearchaeota archaeon]|nr:MAG: hypothetical protein EU529_04295 [Candidatus Lokiarchaeota archaeon]